MVADKNETCHVPNPSKPMPPQLHRVCSSCYSEIVDEKWTCRCREYHIVTMGLFLLVAVIFLISFFYMIITKLGAT